MAALAAGAVMLVAVLARIAELWSSRNKIAVLWPNLVLLIRLVGGAWLALGFVRRCRKFAAVERWQMLYLPRYEIWAAVVVLMFQQVFAFR